MGKSLFLWPFSIAMLVITRGYTSQKRLTHPFFCGQIPFVSGRFFWNNSFSVLCRLCCWCRCYKHCPDALCIEHWPMLSLKITKTMWPKKHQLYVALYKYVGDVPVQEIYNIGACWIGKSTKTTTKSAFLAPTPGWFPTRRPNGQWWRCAVHGCCCGQARW